MFINNYNRTSKCRVDTKQHVWKFVNPHKLKHIQNLEYGRSFSYILLYYIINFTENVQLSNIYINYYLFIIFFNILFYQTLN